MSRVNADKLSSALHQGLPPIILVTGDEPLLVQESCDQIRSAATQHGFSERERHHTDSGFTWDTLLQNANSLSLFAEKKFIEVRVHNGKPGDAGGKAITEYCGNTNDDTALLLVLPKIDKRSQNTKWFKTVESTGLIVTVWPVGPEQLPRWINQRLNAAGLSAEPAAIDILCAKVEGNLLAAQQEVEKLKLITNDKIISAELMTSAVMESARYDVFGLIDKALSGNSESASHTLHGLRGEGTEPAVILWALTRETRTLTHIKEAVDAGASFGQIAQSNGVWQKRQPLVQRALNRHNKKSLYAALRKCALADKTIKGMAQAEIWPILLDITLGLSGVNCLNDRTQRALLKS